MPTLIYRSPDYIWGVIDMIPETDFPDIRCRTAIHSNNGSCMIIPREGDLVRLYIQLTDTDVLNPETGRVDRSKMGPEKLLAVAQKSFYPFKIDTKAFDWSTIYISELVDKLSRASLMRMFWDHSWATRGVEVLDQRTCVHCWRCVPYTFTESRCGGVF